MAVTQRLTINLTKNIHIMPIDILLTLVLTTIIQSLFGVGILLFGTPILLLLGYDFSFALSVLLPISISVNLLQIIKHYQYIDFKIYKNTLCYSIPFIVLFLAIITNIHFNISLIVGVFLLLVAAKNLFPSVDKKLSSLIQYERSFLAVTGIVHGISNLGGSLLTALIHKQDLPKHNTRVTVALCYASFALVQLLTLFLIGFESGLSYSVQMSLLQISIVVFLITEEMVYKQIDNSKYTRLFALFLAISGGLLLYKSF